MKIVQAAAIEYPHGVVNVLSDAEGLARKFFFRIGNWRVQGSVRHTAILARVEAELRARGVQADVFRLRVGDV